MVKPNACTPCKKVDASAASPSASTSRREGFVHRPPRPQADRAEQSAQQEGDAPTPVVDGIRSDP
jgi:hypothetical protein